MPKAHGSLAGVLDQQVYTAVGKLLDKTGASLRDTTADDAYVYISKSNSTLARKSKVLLLDSISRVLEVMKADQEDELDDAADSPPEDVVAAADSSNAMNRMLTASWRIAAEPHREEAQHTPRPAKRASEPGDRAHASKRSVKKLRLASTASVGPAPTPEVPLDLISGMDKQIEILIYDFQAPFLRPELYQTMPRGLLLHGPPGCGKTMLCEAFGHALQVPFIRISASSVTNGISGESEKAIRDQFETAVKCAPSVIFVDDIDVMLPKRESTQRGMEQRMTSTFIECLDGLDPSRTNGKAVMVMATTRQLDSLDSNLRRAGRLDAEIEMGVPDAQARQAILRAKTRNMNLAEDVDLASITRHTHGFVGADLTALVRAAEKATMSRVIGRWRQAALAERDIDMSDGPPSAGTLPTPGATVIALRDYLAAHPEVGRETDGSERRTTLADFQAALATTKASSTREGFTSNPQVPWDAVGAYHEIRQALQEDIVGAILQPEAYAQLGLQPPGVLLHGPPGCGKTLLAKAVASAANANIITVKGPELLSKYVGESEKAIRQLFARARASQPVIIFFDEVDGLVPRRDDSDNSVVKRLVNVMLTEIDGFDPLQGVHIMAATNRPHDVDPALLRPGRLSKSVYVGLPSAAERVEILATVLRRRAARDADRAEMAAVGADCHGFSGADLEHLAYEAGVAALRRCTAAGAGVADMAITAADVRLARARVAPSVRPEDAARKV